MLEVRFYSLGPASFKVEKIESYATLAQAFEAIEAHAHAGGYRIVKIVDDDDPGSIRFTATTPGGRHGRNVALGDWVGENDLEEGGW